MDLSVIIPTYDRACLLPQGLAALAGQRLPAASRWELVRVGIGHRS